MKITEKIKSFEDACEHLGIEAKLPVVDGLHPDHQRATIAYYKLFVIASALNEGWKPNWSDYSERKYFPWWYVDSSHAGLSFAYSYYGFSVTYTSVGSRIGFKTGETAEYAGNQFKSLYEDALLFN